MSEHGVSGFWAGSKSLILNATDSLNASLQELTFKWRSLNVWGVSVYVLIENQRVETISQNQELAEPPPRLECCSYDLVE